ncbi:MAG: hypothetical protein AB7I41_10735 [Candidatus Sericytochromatia bacterium]
MMKKWTVAGSPALERDIDEMILGLRSRLQASFSREDYSAVVIAGGYGRGEGGVHWVNGKETLHNNLDLVWVAPHASQLEQIRSKLENEARHFEQEYGVALDSFVIDEARLKRLPCLVMLYDMKFGHRLLMGEAKKWENMIPYDVKAILPSDMRNLLVNRGSLLLINRWLLAQGEPDPELRQQIIRHGMKAVIGLGDALLFMRGEYHWSYREKQHRMNAALDLPAKLRQAYHQAAEFRYQPDYAAFKLTDLQLWNESLLDLFAQGHQRFEAWRLEVPSVLFTWKNYPSRAISHSLRAEWRFRGTRLRRLKHFIFNQSYSHRLGLTTNLGLRFQDNASLLALIFPAVAYELSDSDYLGFVREQLNAKALTFQDLLGDFLMAWGGYLDPGLLPRLKIWQKKLQHLEVAA